MIAEIGHFALILALAVALVQASVPLMGAQRGNTALMALAGPASVAQFLCVAVAFAALMHAYVTSDFSLLNVAQNSHTMKPMLYKVAGVWSNHEGSLLLWVTILALFGMAVTLFGGNLPPGLRVRALAVQAMIAVGFLLFILLTSNPFTRLNPPPMDGNGLNPLLQDPGLAFHPPFLYLGYVGFSMAFSFAVAALIEGKVDAAWARWVRPWTLAAWIFLTCGIALGSWWAYYTLGWGGIGLALWLLLATLTELADRTRFLRVPLAESVKRALSLPRSAWGMTLAHAGLAVVIAGMTGSAAWKSEAVQNQRVGETVNVAGIAFTLDRVERIQGPNYTADRATFTVVKDGKVLTQMSPEKRQFMAPPRPATNAAIHSSVTGDIYAVLGEPAGDGGWVTRLYFNPLVPWMWGGALMLVLGGVISLSDRRHRVGAPARAAALAKA